ncbi:phosphate/phosphite/phosphonate ABC transporter substrate-binding protein [Rhodosalinus sp. FB01]|uniref:phosphate/phosphite/phosphonate ABC transporter substrate-binding protein n=1 Tax=Rhodosalinus sp. FB01 TaxID=3239194 RepID=UPI00352333C0
MIAALPMDDRPETAAANDSFWRAIRGELGYGPEALTRGRDPWEIWEHPDLLLAQTCGYPFRTRLRDRVTLVGTPDYALEGCPPGHYRSVFVARRDDPGDLPAFAGRRFAFNEALSQSGWAAPAHHMAEAGLGFGPLLRTGAHAASARAVASGRADFAALDAQTWRLIAAHDDFAGALRVIARTRPTPGLPLITARGRDPGPILAAVRRAAERLDPADRTRLCLAGIVAIPAAAYFEVPTPAPPESDA